MTTDPQELARAARLLNDVFGHDDPLTVESLQWYYDANPVAPAAVGRVEEGGRRLGNYALVPQVYVDPGGQERVLGVGVDLAVDPDARGSGAFRRTVEDAYERGTASGFDGILGVANANSAPRMVATLGWRALDPLPVTLLAPLGRAPGFVTHEATPAFLDGPGYAWLTEGGFVTGDAPGFAPRWTPESLRWRLARPGHRYWLHADDDLIVVSTATRMSGLPFAVVLLVQARRPLPVPVPSGRVAALVARVHRTPMVVHWGRNPWLRVRGRPPPAVPDAVAAVARPAPVPRRLRPLVVRALDLRVPRLRCLLIPGATGSPGLAWYRCRHRPVGSGPIRPAHEPSS